MSQTQNNQTKVKKPRKPRVKKVKNVQEINDDGTIKPPVLDQTIVKLMPVTIRSDVIEPKDDSDPQPNKPDVDDKSNDYNHMVSWDTDLSPYDENIKPVNVTKIAITAILVAIAIIVGLAIGYK